MGTAPGPSAYLRVWGDIVVQNTEEQMDMPLVQINFNPTQPLVSCPYNHLKSEQNTIFIVFTIY